MLYYLPLTHFHQICWADCRGWGRSALEGMPLLHLSNLSLAYTAPAHLNTAVWSSCELWFCCRLELTLQPVKSGKIDIVYYAHHMGDVLYRSKMPVIFSLLLDTPSKVGPSGRTPLRRSTGPYLQHRVLKCISPWTSRDRGRPARNTENWRRIIKLCACRNEIETFPAKIQLFKIWMSKYPYFNAKFYRETRYMNRFLWLQELQI